MTVGCNQAGTDHDAAAVAVAVTLLVQAVHSHDGRLHLGENTFCIFCWLVTVGACGMNEECSGDKRFAKQLVHSRSS
ncbi:hypothetical protein D9M68_908590 [compost metagenome]